MTSRNLLNVVLALVLTGLVILVIYEPGKEIPVSGSRLTSLLQADIKTIKIVQPQQDTIILQKNTGGWQMQEPFSIPANNELIAKILAVSGTNSHSSYTASEVNLDQLRLSMPGLSIYLNDTQLDFGDTDALHGHRYVLTTNRVHLITDRFSHLVRGKPAVLVSLSPLPGNPALKKLVLPGLTVYKEEAAWMVKPDSSISSADQIEKLVDDWRYARAIQVSQLEETTIRTGKTNTPAIEIHTIDNIYQFEVLTMEDEIILVRPELGLRYHFTLDVGKKLLGIHHDVSESAHP